MSRKDLVGDVLVKLGAVLVASTSWKRLALLGNAVTALYLALGAIGLGWPTAPQWVAALAGAAFFAAHTRLQRKLTAIALSWTTGWLTGQAVQRGDLTTWLCLGLVAAMTVTLYVLALRRRQTPRAPGRVWLRLPNGLELPLIAMPCHCSDPPGPPALHWHALSEHQRIPLPDGDSIVHSTKQNGARVWLTVRETEDGRHVPCLADV